MKEKTPIRQTVAANLRFLMDRENPKVTQSALAKRVFLPGESKPVSQKTISNLLHAVHDPSIELLSAVSEIFSLDLWQMIRPGLRQELASGKRVAQLIDDFYDSSPEGQNLIGSFAEHEAKRAQGVGS